MSVKIHFGPYEAHGLIQHKTQRLFGVLTRLNELDYEVELVPSKYLNLLTVTMMKEKLIFRCDIRNLLFNVPYEDDPVAQRLIETVEEAKERMYSEDNVPQFSLKQSGPHRQFSHTQDLLSDDVELLFEIPAWNVGIEHQF